MTYRIIPLFIFSLLLIGGGCTSSVEKTSQQDTETSSTLSAVIKAPNGETESPVTQKRQSDTAYCESYGYDVITRFDELTQTSIAYCQFDNGSECIASEYRAGLCSPTAGSGTSSSQDTIDPIIETVCESENEPVCGVNGHTYANACLAIQTSVEIKHTGRCTAEEIAAQIAHDATQTEAEKFPLIHMEGIGTGSTASQTDDTDRTNFSLSTGPTHPTRPPSWVDSVIVLVESEDPTVPRRYIDSCIRGDYQYYLETNGTDTVPSTAFTPEGKIICYPNKDFNNRCPEEILLSANCKRLYTDAR